MCGLPDIPLLKYTKHIELCWARSEKAISFGAPEKNNDMFYCEKYDSRTNSFCKRLKSLCPEHRKLGDEQHLKVCGYPKKWEDGMIETAKTVSELIEMEELVENLENFLMAEDPTRDLELFLLVFA